MDGQDDTPQIDEVAAMQNTILAMRDLITPKITFEKLLDTAVIPTHHGESQHDNVGMDFYAAEDVNWRRVFHENTVGHADVIQKSPSIVSVALVRTGLRVALPPGMHLRFASRSGLATKSLLYAFPGTVDSSFRGELMIQLLAFGTHPPYLKAGAKIAQGIVFRSESYNIFEGKVSLDTSRGEAGFGSTGL